MKFGLVDSFGPYLPLAPAFSWLFISSFLGLNNTQYGPWVTIGLFFVLIWKGSAFIHSWFLGYDVIFRISPSKDAKGNDTFFCQTLLVAGRTNVEPGTNSSLFTVSKFTKLWNLRNVSKTKFWGTGTNFDMAKFGSYCNPGTADLIGFPFFTGHCAVMIMEEIETDVDVDYKEEEGTNIAKYDMTSVKELSEWLKQYKKKRMTITV